MEINVRFSNSVGTIEVSGDSNKVASVIEVLLPRLCTRGLTAAETECIRSGDPLKQVQAEEQKPSAVPRKK